MLPTYQGVLRANQIEWTGDGPAHLAPEQAVRVFVTVLGPPSDEASPGQGQRMAAALEKLAALPASSSIADPLGWERDVRQDRPLPGREE